MAESTGSFRSGFVAVVGKPNVGKSTLVNHFVGRKVSIVSPRPQTTRRRILGILNRPDAQIVFVDTPGIHKPKYKLGERMVEAAVGALPDADLILFVVDASKPPNAEDRHIADLLTKEARAPIILVLNKMDKLPPEKVKLHTEAYWQLVPNHADWMMTNAVKRHNCGKLLEMILKRLPESPPYFPQEQITDQPERLFAAEIIREKALLHTYQEVPHGIGVCHRTLGRATQRRTVYCGDNLCGARDPQGASLSGKGGKMLKKNRAASARGTRTSWLGTQNLSGIVGEGARRLAHQSQLLPTALRAEPTVGARFTMHW
jgi:GTP-binding protein Era